MGSETVREIHSFFADRLVFSVKGIEPEGFLTDPDPLEAEVKRAMIARVAHGRARGGGARSSTSAG